ncbi:ornithine cyclodeaminase family protein [Parvibium lacunae]|uniref:Ornithine cyclodeaminase family protein n=1 Tax=Parvibium lacunae TaxID=1888893 RepID=A0A368L4E0_9BURK|nr:ornithine cyclodeaminase family protein [Parvibium lacunae]RCS58439.1 ornithine cyclodeaminase family protein [Parvibium lacunae]
MKYITDEMVQSSISMPEAITVMRDCFTALGRCEATNLDRQRAESQGRYLSVMGGILHSQGVMAAKVYPTIRGQFNFVIPLFDSESGELLAVVEGNALTGLRTAAVTKVAIDALGGAGLTKLTLFGTGIQAYAHARACIPNSAIEQVEVVGLEHVDTFAARLQHEFNLPVTAAEAATAIASAGLVVTATRSTTPLFNGDHIQPGTLITAIGSSKPNCRELDDTALARSTVIGVEWASQTLREAGEFVMSEPAQWQSKVQELGALISRPLPPIQHEIRVYKSVGIGLEDVALAAYIYRKLMA